MFSCVSVCVFTYYFYVFIVKTGGRGGGLSLQFILFPRHELWGEFRVLLCWFAYIRFVSPSASASMFRRWTSSYMDVPFTVHPPAGWVLDDYPSYSLFLVSSAHYILLCIAWCVYGGRGGLLLVCSLRRVNIWRLFQSIFLIILLPPPP